LVPLNRSQLIFSFDTALIRNLPSAARQTVACRRDTPFLVLSPSDTPGLEWFSIAVDRDTRERMNAFHEQLKD
jgi:hypothetical protein